MAKGTGCTVELDVVPALVWGAYGEIPMAAFLFDEQVLSSILL